MNPHLPPGVHWERDAAGLERLIIQTPAAEAHLYLYGAHLTHWQPRDRTPVLWMSRQSWFSPGKPIRGGVPICFPWFGPKAGAQPGDAFSPGHGLARVLPWKLAASDHAAASNQDVTTITLALESGEQTRAFWPHEFRARMTFIIGDALTMRLEVTNTDSRPFTFEEALHTYFAIGDVTRISVTGLAGAVYIDKADGFKRKTQGPDPIVFTAETDRLYSNTSSDTALVDPVAGRRINIAKTGSSSTVVWNPWIAKARAMPDFGDEEWTGMACIETANAGEDAVTLAPGATHAMTAKISVQEL